MTVREVMDRKIMEYRNDPATPDWVRDTIDDAMRADPVEACNMLEKLSELFTVRLGELLTKAR